LALHLPKWEAIHHMGFGVQKRWSSGIIIRLCCCVQDAKPFSRVLQFEGLLKMAAHGHCKRGCREVLVEAFCTLQPFFQDNIVGLPSWFECHKTDICKGKYSGLPTCQTLCENPCVLPFANMTWRQFT
jgi:hypothetical protein